jgi:cytochrome c-type biogenesis protein CcmH
MSIFKQFCLKLPAKWRVLFFTLALSMGQFAHAQVQQPELSLPSPELAQRLKKLESELRCLVCQNQTLAESPAGLAGDLRREVRSLIEQGKTDDEIKTYLQARYGDFVLYKPPVKSTTFLLWYGPFILLGIGAITYFLISRRRRMQVARATNVSVASPTEDTATPPPHRARALLDGDEELDQPAGETKTAESSATEQQKKSKHGKHEKHTGRRK